MTKLLEQAIAEVAKLPEEQQDELARWILETLESDKRWDELFARSQDVLEQMAAEALADFKAGKTEPLDPDTL